MTAPRASAPDAQAALLARVAAGDEAALVTFYERSVDGLYAFVFYRVGKDAALCEDVVHETFLAALARTAEYDAERGSLRAWLCQLSRNVVRKHLRAAKRTRELAMWERWDEALAQAFAGIEEQALVDEVLERQETRDLVSLTLGHLPESYQRVLEAKYVSGQSLEELAREHGLTVDAAKSLLARARRALREAFVACGTAGSPMEVAP